MGRRREVYGTTNSGRGREMGGGSVGTETGGDREK